MARDCFLLGAVILMVVKYMGVFFGEIMFGAVTKWGTRFNKKKGVAKVVVTETKVIDVLVGVLLF